MELRFSLHDDVDGGAIGVLWNSGYFHLALNPSLNDQSDVDSADIKEWMDDLDIRDTAASSASSPVTVPISPFSYVSDSSAASSSMNSASGLNLKKRRRYREKRKERRDNCVKESLARAECGSPAAVYCEQWISALQNTDKKRFTFAGVTDGQWQQTADRDDKALQRSQSLDTERLEENTSWLKVWQSLLKLAPNSASSSSSIEVLEISIDHSPAKKQAMALASISEVESEMSRSSTPNPKSSPQFRLMKPRSLRPPLFKPSIVSACSSDGPHTNPTNQEVCVFVCGISFSLFFKIFDLCICYVLSLISYFKAYDSIHFWTQKQKCCGSLFCYNFL